MIGLPPEPDVPPSLDGLEPEPPKRCPRCKVMRVATDYDLLGATGTRKRTCRVCLSKQRDRQRNVAMTWRELDEQTAHLAPCARGTGRGALAPIPDPPPDTLPAVRVLPPPRPTSASDPHRTSRVHMNGNAYDAMFRLQGGRCASCGRPERETDERGHLRRLVVYWNRTGGAHGLICSGCNRGFDSFCDSPVIMARALAFQAGAQSAAGSSGRVEITAS